MNDFEVASRNMRGAGGSGLDFLCTVVAEAIWLGGRGGEGEGVWRSCSGEFQREIKGLPYCHYLRFTKTFIRYVTDSP